MYIDLSQGNGITVKSHVSRFAEKLKSNIHGLETRNIGKKLAVYLTTTANILISAKIMTTSEIGQSMLDVVCMLRKEMNSIQKKFSGKFLSDCQLKAVPTKLITLISMLIDGCGIENKEFSQEATTISQLIQTNFHKYSKKDLSTHHRIQKYRETPVALYTTLKIYATVRSKNLINTFFNM